MVLKLVQKQNKFFFFLDTGLMVLQQRLEEQLTLLGWTENRWKFLDKVTIKNLQNSLVCFELNERYSVTKPKCNLKMFQKEKKKVLNKKINILLPLFSG